MDGPTYTRLCEGFTHVAQPDNGGHVVGYGFDFVNGKPVQPGDTITEDEAAAYFPTPYGQAATAARVVVGPCFLGLDVVRKAALTDMTYELGAAGLAQFRHMIMAVNVEQWDTAATACLASVYAAQVPERAARTAYMLRTGLWPEGYGG